MEKDKFDWAELISWFIVIAISMFAIAWLSSCKTIQYVPVETIKTEKEYIDRLQVDTLICKDSVIIREKGDCEDKEHIRYVYRVKDLHDTVNIATHDTITKVTEIEVEKQLGKIDKLCLKLGKFAFPLLLFLLIIGGFYIYRKIRGKK